MADPFIGSNLTFLGPKTSSSFNVGPFACANLGASTTQNAGRFGTTGASLPWTPTRSGRIVAVSCRVVNGGSDLTLTGTALSIHVNVGGVQTSNIVTVANGTAYNYAVLASPISFAAGVSIFIRMATDAGWLDTTADPMVDLEIQYD